MSDTSHAPPASVRLEAESLARQGDWVSMRSLLDQTWARNPGPATAAFINSVWKAPTEATAVLPLIHILRSFTLEPARPLLRAAGIALGLPIDVRLGEFNAYAQELLDPASVAYTSRPTVIVLAVQTRDVAPQLWVGTGSPDALATQARETAAAFAQWIGTLRRCSTAHLIIHLLEQPAHARNGVRDAMDSAGQRACIDLVNDHIREAARAAGAATVVDLGSLIAKIGRDRWHDERRWTTTRLPLTTTALQELVAEWMRSISPVCGRTIKAIVTDLDNTLWDGIVGEDGVEGIAADDSSKGFAHHDYQQALRALMDQGFLLAIASKNNPADVEEAFARHVEFPLRLDDFVARKVGWHDKAQSVREIARELNVGVDAILFVDDNPIERQAMRSALPEVSVLELPANPMQYASVLRESPLVQRLHVTGEDRRRSALYRQRSLAAAAAEQAHSKEDFLTSLDQAVSLDRVHEATLVRATQLTNKTNQFNLTTIRYSEDDLRRRASDPRSLVLTASVVDRFADNGIVAVAVLHHSGNVLTIESLLMSCRVIARSVETGILAGLVQYGRDVKCTHVAGFFRPTAKNEPAASFFTEHGFVCSRRDPDGASHWVFDMEQGDVSCPPWLRLHSNLHNST